MTNVRLSSTRIKLHRVVRSSVGRVFAVSASVTLAGFLTSLVLNRALGPTGRGALAAALIIAGLLPYLASTGLVTAVLYYSGPNRDGGPRTLATALPIGLAQSAVAGIVGYFLIPVLIGNQGSAVVDSARLALWSLPANVLTLYITATYQSHLRFRMFNILRSLVTVGALLGALTLNATGHLTPLNMVIIYTTLPFIALSVGIVAARKTNFVNSLSPNREMARRLYRYGSKAFVGELSSSVNLRFDQVLIAIFLPTRSLGLYVAAVSASQLTVMLSYSLRAVVQPSIANELHPHNRWVLFRQGIIRYTRIGLAMSIVLAVIVPLAIPLLFGEAFRAAIIPTELLIWAVYVLGFKDILAGAAQGYGDPWLASRAELIGAGVTISTLLLLVPHLGISGAALSSLISYTTQALLILHFLRKHHAPSVGLTPADQGEDT